jgi:hypothetical protein
MATFTAYLKRCSDGAAMWYPRKITRRSDKVPFLIYDTLMDNSISGYVFLNRASVVGCGGSLVTITDTTSTIAITE